MWRSRSAALVLGVATVASLMAVACGGAASTATPAPRETPAPTPTPAPATRPASPAAPTATGVPASTAAASPTPTARVAQPTTTPRPTPTPVPAAASPASTPLNPRRGGTLLLRSQFQPRNWDMYDVRGNFDFHTLAPMFNNLIWPDPYAQGNPLVGDAAEGWTVEEGGKGIVFRLRKGILFHDGQPMTARDVVYNIDRAARPRSANMTVFKPRVEAISGVTAVDDYTVRVALSKPSNALLQVMGMTQFAMYPASSPFPLTQPAWVKSPVGSGPFIFKSIDAEVDMKFLRNTRYWKPGLPYVDAITIINATNEITQAGFRSGRFDVANFDTSALERVIPALERERGFITQWVTVSTNVVLLNNKPPWNDPLVRQALDLAIDRHAVLKLWLDGQGSPYVAPLLAPELGGQWGISVEETKKRPGYAPDKAADLRQAKALLERAGVDPSKVSMRLLGSPVQQIYAEVVESNFSSLGFKVKLDIVATGVATDDMLAGRFDANATTASITFDDPSDYLTPFVSSQGGFNYGKWVSPNVDRLLEEQDREPDVAKRKAVLLQLQKQVLEDRHILPVLNRLSVAGHQKWVKNHPVHRAFLFGPFFRWEQLWLER